MFDSVGTEGTPLFPRRTDGSIDPFLRAKLYNRIERLEKLNGMCYAWWRKETEKITEDYVASAKEQLRFVNSFATDGSYLASDILGSDTLSAVDIALFPFAENWLCSDDTLLS